MNILVIEDNEETQAQVVEALSKQGHTVECSVDGRRGLALADAGNYDVIVVDRMLPGLDGLSVVKLLRDRGKTSPVLFVTNLDGIDDRVEGLKRVGTTISSSHSRWPSCSRAYTRWDGGQAASKPCCVSGTSNLI